MGKRHMRAALALGAFVLALAQLQYSWHQLYRASTVTDESKNQLTEQIRDGYSVDHYGLYRGSNAEDGVVKKRRLEHVDHVKEEMPENANYVMEIAKGEMFIGVNQVKHRAKDVVNIEDRGARDDKMHPNANPKQAKTQHVDQRMQPEVETNTKPNQNAKTGSPNQAFETSEKNTKITTISRAGNTKRGQQALPEKNVFGTFSSFLSTLAGTTHDKWMVLDVSTGECGTATIIAPSGWKVIMVGETTHKMECKPPTCYRLVPPEVFLRNTTSERNLWTRNGAYLIAFMAGAVQIFDAECPVPSSDIVKALEFTSTKASGLMYNETTYFNPYSYFGAWLATPSAVASWTENRRNSKLFYLRDFPSVLVKHGVSAQSDELVWVNSHSERTEEDTAGTRFDTSVPPVYVGQGTYTPVGTRYSVYHREAVWGLLLPCSSPNIRRCKILRQFVTQRILREVDAFSSFHQVLEKPSSPPKGADVGDFVKHGPALDSWVCKANSTFFACFEELASFMREEGLIGSDDRDLIRSWIAMLRTLGVAEPTRISRPWRGVRKIGEVPVVFSNLQAEMEHDDSILDVQRQFVEPVKARCSGYRSIQQASASQWLHPLITDVVLVIVFNHNKFVLSNLPYMETTHRPYFKHIVYCTPNVTELMDTGNQLLSGVTLVEGHSDEWYMMYECLSNAARINIQNVRGYLQIGDDTLLNTWALLNMSRDSVWLPNGFTNLYAGEGKHRWGWYFWTTHMGQHAILRALSDVERVSKMTSDQILRLDPTYDKTKSPRSKTFSQILHSRNASDPARKPRVLLGTELWEDPSREDSIHFLTNYIRGHRMSGRIAHRALDLFYIPHKLREAFVKFSRFFMKRRVMIELAVPAIHYGIASRSEVLYVKASSLWRADRDISEKFYDDSMLFLHPFKMKTQLGMESGRQMFCDIYGSRLFSQLLKMPVV